MGRRQGRTHRRGRKWGVDEGLDKDGGHDGDEHGGVGVDKEVGEDGGVTKPQHWPYAMSNA